MNETFAYAITAEQRRALLQDEVERCVPLLVEHYQALKVVLFGSLANGKIGEWSDLDLVVVKKTDKRFFDRIKEVIQILRPQVGMDILVYTSEEYETLIHECAFVQREIGDKGTVLYER